MNLTERISVDEFRRRGLKAAKYGNARNVVDGIRFDSKLEADRYVELKKLQHCGVVRWFIMQAPFRLPGGITYRADFVVIWAPAAPEQFAGDSDVVSVEDCKGFMTRVSLNKIKQVEELYGITVRIITKRGKTR